MSYENKKHKIKHIFSEQKKTEDEISKKQEIETFHSNELLNNKGLLSLFETDWQTAELQYSRYTHKETWGSVEGTPYETKTVEVTVRGEDTDTISLNVSADALWVGSLDLKARTFYYNPDMPDHPLWYANATGTKQFIDEDGNKELRINSEVEASTYKVQSGSYVLTASGSVFNDDGGTDRSYFYTDYLNADILENTVISTEGSFAATIAGDYTNFRAYVILSVDVEITNMPGLSNIEIVYIQKKSGSSDPNVYGNQIFIDWTTMSRNFYDEIKTILLNTYGKTEEEIAAASYRLDRVRIGFDNVVNTQSLGTEEEVGVQHQATSSLNFVNKFVKFSIDETVSYICYLSSTEFIMRDQFLPFVNTEIIVKLDNEIEDDSIEPVELFNLRAGSDNDRKMAFVRTKTIDETSNIHKYKLLTEIKFYQRIYDNDDISKSPPQVKLLGNFIPPNTYIADMSGESNG